MITKVRNQGSFGSCFAFGIIETIKSMAALKTGRLAELSVQHMIDCNDLEMDCGGGDPCHLLRWLMNGKVDMKLNDDKSTSEKSDRKCETGRLQATGIKVKDYSCNK